MVRVKPVEEAHYVDMSDQDLIKLIGSLWEHIKTIDEKVKDDAWIKDQEDKIKEYKAQKYIDEQKAYKAKLKGSRAIAKARGLKFELPRRKGDDYDEAD